MMSEEADRSQVSEVPPAVTVSGLTKVFGGGLGKKAFAAVKQVSFTVKAGEVYGLIGPNGSGKSTIMKVVLGLLAPTLGESRIFGCDSRNVVSRSEVGFLPENPYFYKHLSGGETLMFYGKLCGMRGRALKLRIDEMLELTGLTDARERRVGGFSKGMLQRLGLAQALIHEPRLVILDEPTAGVDPEGSRKIRDLIMGFKERGLTVLVTSHLLEQMQEVCDRVGIMSQGCMVREGRLDELIAVEEQTELVLEHADGALLEKIQALVEAHQQEGGGKARLLRMGHPRTTLERFFLEATGGAEQAKESGGKQA
jgi:ABC-2 type transport system ATP-binding protein